MASEMAVKRVGVSITGIDSQNEADTLASLHVLMNKLQSINEISIERTIREHHEPLIPFHFFFQIVAYKTSSRAFNTAYILLEDFHSIRKNVEIELKFEDSPSIKINNFDAENVLIEIERHFANTKDLIHTP